MTSAPKPHRKGRKILTLIAAVRSATGIAVAADSQETVGEYRRSVQKLAPRNDGFLHTVIAGSGDGELIDSFILRFYENLPSQPCGITSLSDFKAFAQAELEEFYRRDVALSTALPEDKRISLLIGASLMNTGEFDAWRCKGINLERIGAYDLLGWDHPLYDAVIQRMLSPLISLQQSILAAVYTLVIAEKTSNYCKGPTSLVVILPGEIRRERSDYIEELEYFLGSYEKEVHEIFLACADTSLSPLQLRAKLEAFTEISLYLHKRHLDSVAGDLDNILNTPYAKLPPGTTVRLSIEDGPMPEYDVPDRKRITVAPFSSSEIRASEPSGPKADEPDTPAGKQGE